MFVNVLKSLFLLLVYTNYDTFLCSELTNVGVMFLLLPCYLEIVFIQESRLFLFWWRLILGWTYFGFYLIRADNPHSQLMWLAALKSLVARRLSSALRHSPSFTILLKHILTSNRLFDFHQTKRYFRSFGRPLPMLYIMCLLVAYTSVGNGFKKEILTKHFF